jgi:threonine synthase
MAESTKAGMAAGARLTRWPGLIEHYRRFLPVTDKTPVVTLNEGNTPLIESPDLTDRVGRNIKVYLKFEGANPTGSFKDRGMTVAMS